MIYIILILVILILLLEKFIDKQQEISPTIPTELNYKKKNYIYTVTELKFYRELIKITDELNLVVFPKIRLADIFEHTDIKEFNKIKSKHVDFLLCDKSNCKIRLAIELDDYTHNQGKSIKNDNFKNEIFKQAGLGLIRIKVSNSYNLEYIKEKIKESL